MGFDGHDTSRLIISHILNKWRLASDYGIGRSDFHSHFEFNNFKVEIESWSTEVE